MAPNGNAGAVCVLFHWPVRDTSIACESDPYSPRMRGRMDVYVSRSPPIGD